MLSRNTLAEIFGCAYLQMLWCKFSQSLETFQLKSTMVRISEEIRNLPARKYYGANFATRPKPDVPPGLRVSRPHVANWLKDMSRLQKPLENRGTDFGTAHYDHHPKVSFFCKIINFLNPL